MFHSPTSLKKRFTAPGDKHEEEGGLHHRLEEWIFLVQPNYIWGSQCEARLFFFSGYIFSFGTFFLSSTLPLNASFFLKTTRTRKVNEVPPKNEKGKLFFYYTLFSKKRRLLFFSHKWEPIFFLLPLTHIIGG